MNKNEDHLLLFFERLKNISAIKRFGNFPVLQFESVAGHSFNVAIISLLIADYENDSEINVEIVLRKALFHDFEESILSDIPHSIKHRYKGGKLAKMLKEIVPGLIEDKIFKELPKSLQGNCIKNSKEAKIGTEGEIVEAGDAMDTIVTAIRELKLGNLYFEQVFDAAVAQAEKHNHFKFVKIFLESAQAYRSNIHQASAENI
ncbi:MAG: HD domain-containing protein [Fibrobacteria bacterium]|nr:HD domain-containing protein [Fibrobacteria bacterium]